MSKKILPLLIDLDKTNTVTEGVATTGEISPQGTVSHTEHWDGRIDATVRPATVDATASMQSPKTPIVPGTITFIGQVEM